jgi:hypothetical protein
MTTTFNFKSTSTSNDGKTYPIVVLLDEVERSALVFSEKLIENRRLKLKYEFVKF